MWMAQLFFNALATGALCLLFVQKRKIFKMEKELRFLKVQWLHNLEGSVSAKALEGPKLLPATTSISGSSLNEKEMPEPALTSHLDRYERAQNLFAQGLELREIAKQTGLSISEIQLLGKMAQKNQ